MGWFIREYRIGMEFGDMDELGVSIAYLSLLFNFSLCVRRDREDLGVCLWIF